MDQIKDVTFSKPPTMLAAWPGMGNVGLIVVDYIRRKLNATQFGEIDMSPFFIPDSIVVKQGMAEFPDIPSSTFFYTSDPPLIVFESNAQVGGREGIAVIKGILDLAKECSVTEIYTAAAFAQPMSFTTPSQVLGACNQGKLLEKIQQNKVIPLPEGYIAGQNGLLLGVAAPKGIPAACLLGTIPSYATNLSYPKASLEIIKVLQEMVGSQVDVSELAEGVQQMDRQFATIEERIREFFPNVAKEETDEEISGLDEEKVPHFIMERIERLFGEAAKDRDKATLLKQELDRWNLYELYENRFLDLFEDKKDDKGTGRKEE